MSPIKAHIEEAYQQLTGEAYRVPAEAVDNPAIGVPLTEFCVVAVELERIDAALGPPGNSMFARLADRVRAAYVEIIAARKLLEEPTT